MPMTFHDWREWRDHMTGRAYEPGCNICGGGYDDEPRRRRVPNVRLTKAERRRFKARSVSFARLLTAHPSPAVCHHPSSTGVDQAPHGPEKVWRCDACGETWSDDGLPEDRSDPAGAKVCYVCGEAFKVGDDVTSDYYDEIVHFGCGPDGEDRSDPS